MRHWKWLILVFAAAVFGQSGRADDISPTSREVLTCGDREGKLFQSWSRAAGKSTTASAIASAPGAEIFDIPMQDGRTIRGIRLRTAAKARGFVLVIPGNAWIAETFSSYAAQFTAAGLDVYIPDFRGYGLSQPGIPSVSAMMADYSEVSKWIWTQGYTEGYVYGFSFGGVVAVDALAGDTSFKKIVVDSVPSHPAHILGLTCTVNYDPSEHLPADCSKLVVMHGTSDWLVSNKKARDFLDKAKACGATLDAGKPRGHPFQIEWRSTSMGRIHDVIEHFTAP